MTWNQLYFELHESSLASKNLSNFQLLHDAKSEVVGSQMPPKVKISGNATKVRNVEGVVTKKEDHVKKLKM